MEHRLVNGRGLEARVIELGATWTHMWVPDRYGERSDVLLGFDDPAHYRHPHPCLGSTVGRVANRIARGQFELDGRRHQLPCNEGEHHLHGGPGSIHTRLWDCQRLSESQVRLRILDPDGCNGYPGNLQVEVTFTLTEADEFRIDYRATCDQDTPINLTNHAYFNLGDGPDVSDHQVQLYASRYTPVDAHCIPTGKIAAVAGTPVDYRELRRLGDACVDLNFVVDGPTGRLRPVGRVVHPGTGRWMEVESDQSGVQFFTGNCLDGSLIGKAGRAYPFRGGLCLETQNFPNAINQPGFPDCLLRVGEEFRSTTIYRFGATSSA